jgi:hypothetical protein
MPRKSCEDGRKVIGTGEPAKRSVDVDDKDYLEMFLDDGYDDEAADDDYSSGVRGWWSNEWVVSRWMDSDNPRDQRN